MLGEKRHINSKLFRNFQRGTFNPLCQFIVKATNPLVIPLRRVLPGFGGIDLSSLVLSLLIQSLLIAVLLFFVKGSIGNPGTILLASVFSLVALLLNVVFFAIIAIISVVAALRMVTTNNVVHAALYLLVVLAAVAGLYIILGRNDEAEVSLRQSLEIKPDFWNAFDHLAMARMRVKDFAGAEDVLAEARATGGCPEYWDVGIECSVKIGTLAHADQWSEIQAYLGEDSPCLEGHSSGYAEVMKHLAAMQLDDVETALAIEDKVEKALSAAKEVRMLDMPMIMGTLSHLQGVRMAVQGDLEGAIAAFWEADENITYIPAESGMFKLYNRLYLVEALFAAGAHGIVRVLAFR